MLDVRAILWLESYLQVGGWQKVLIQRKSEGGRCPPLPGWWDQPLCSGLMVLRPPSCCLQTWQSTILVVSHDRNFLNAVATDIIHLHSQRLDMYRGDFENFIKTKEERLKNQQREYEAQQQYREHIQVLGEAGGAGAFFSQPCPFLSALVVLL